MKKKIYNFRKIFSILFCLIVLGSSVFAVEVRESFITGNSIIGGLNYVDNICIIIQKAITVFLGFALVFELITAIANHSKKKSFNTIHTVFIVLLSLNILIATIFNMNVYILKIITLVTISLVSILTSLIRNKTISKLLTIIVDIIGIFVILFFI